MRAPRASAPRGFSRNFRPIYFRLSAQCADSTTLFLLSPADRGLIDAAGVERPLASGRVDREAGAGRIAHLGPDRHGREGEGGGSIAGARGDDRGLDGVVAAANRVGSTPARIAHVTRLRRVER